MDGEALAPGLRGAALGIAVFRLAARATGLRDVPF
jgi:hypothetical protein